MGIATFAFEFVSILMHHSSKPSWKSPRMLLEVSRLYGSTTPSQGLGQLGVTQLYDQSVPIEPKPRSK